MKVDKGIQKHSLVCFLQFENETTFTFNFKTKYAQTVDKINKS